MPATATIIVTANFIIPSGKQPCPNCGSLIGNIAGSKEAICKNCGFKDPCCE